MHACVHVCVSSGLQQLKTQVTWSRPLGFASSGQKQEMGENSVAGLLPSVNRAYLLPLPRRQGYPFSSVTYKLQKLLSTLLPKFPQFY